MKTYRDQDKMKVLDLMLIEKLSHRAALAQVGIEASATSANDWKRTNSTTYKMWKVYRERLEKGEDREKVLETLDEGMFEANVEEAGAVYAMAPTVSTMPDVDPTRVAKYLECLSKGMFIEDALARARIPRATREYWVTEAAKGTEPFASFLEEELAAEAAFAEYVHTAVMRGDGQAHILVSLLTKRKQANYVVRPAAPMVEERSDLKRLTDEEIEELAAEATKE